VKFRSCTTKYETESSVQLSVEYSQENLVVEEEEEEISL
jgi:hypothetical protein